MSWPKLIQLHDSQHSHAYDGTEIRETWYVEPASAQTAFIAAMLGMVVPNNGDNLSRAMPACHFLYPWCFATACEVVPYDPRSVSYRGSTQVKNFSKPSILNLSLIVDMVGKFNIPALQPNQTPFALDPTADIDKVSVAQGNKQYSAGTFITVTYLPLLRSSGEWSSAGLSSSVFDGISVRLVPQIRENVINAGLKLVTPQILNLGNNFYPSAGIAPVMKEEYQELIIERRMLPANFNLSQLGKYINCVNGTTESFPNTPVVGDINYSFPPETLRFTKYVTKYVQVPTVDPNGEPAGFNRWMNLELHYDWRQIYQKNVYNATGERANPQIFNNAGNPVGFTAVQVGWNHVLAYPGDLTRLLAFIGNGGVGGDLGWYHARYPTGAAVLGGADADPYPQIGDVVTGGKIMDTVYNLFTP